MTKCFFIFIFLVSLSTSGAFSQTVDSKVEKIREIYAATNRRVAAGLKDNTQGLHYAVWRVGGAGDGKQWAAVGTMETTDEIWFEGGAAESEEGEENLPARISKIVLTYKSSNATHSRREFYFDQAGNLVFILAAYDADSDAGKPVEQRFYYSGEKLIRVALGGKNTDRNFSADELEKAEMESRTARQMRKHYAEWLGE